jgi:CubicO group peptidase (beta-lactamase class C family)
MKALPKFNFGKPLLILLIFLPSISHISNSQSVKQSLIRAKLCSEIDSILQSQVDQDKIPGAVIEIKKGNQLIYKHAYGYALKYDYNHHQVEQPEQMTDSHLFDIASLTKVIGTTTSIMMLVDRGLVKIDDRVGKYIYAFNTPEKQAITIRNLLTHTAGLYEWYPLYYRVSGKQECYRLIGALPLMSPIGEQRRYSDLGFIVLGEIVELVSGMPLEQFMKQNIFRPLGMKNTTFNPLSTGSFKKIAATSPGNPYEKRMVYDSLLGYKIKGLDPALWNGWRSYILKGEVNDGNTWYVNGGISGAAGLFSTVGDLQKLVDMLMNKGKARFKQFISKKTVKAFLVKDRFNNGLGWMMDPVNSFMKNGPEGTFGHTGFTGTSIAVIPEYKTSVILLINRQNTGLSIDGEYYNVNPVRQQVFGAVLNYCKTATGKRENKSLITSGQQ